MTSTLEELFAFQLDSAGMDGYEPYKSGGTKDETRGSYDYFRQLYREQKRGADVKPA